MKSTPFYILLLLACLLPSTTVLAHSSVLEYYYQQHLDEKTSLAVQNSIDEKMFQQLIDHHHPEMGTFAQRYYIDESYGKKADAPVFLYICGEGTCNKSALNGAIRYYAKKYQAKLVALEHRYYGKSLPRNSFSTTDLHYLSTEAALNDLANFQRQLSADLHLTGKWVAFGGSYPGSLSAFYRLKHPDLVVGALASSAPVMSKEDFYEFDAHVTEVVGEHCANNMRAVVRELEFALPEKLKMAELKALFNASDVDDDIDFLYFVADTGALAVQYGHKDLFCSALAENPSPLEGYAGYVRYVLDTLKISAVNLTPQGALSENPSDYGSPDEVNFGLRQWMYQSCTEYGYWQNANPDKTKSTRSSLINASYHQDICQRLFGITQPAEVERMNKEYYFPLMDESSNRIYFTNGQNDPWSTLSITEQNGNNSNKNHRYTLIAGAAHCDDLHPPKALDSIALINARNTMMSLLEEWLKAP